jgi:hypothetical protein
MMFLLFPLSRLLDCDFLSLSNRNLIGYSTFDIVPLLLHMFRISESFDYTLLTAK